RDCQRAGHPSAERARGQARRPHQAAEAVPLRRSDEKKRGRRRSVPPGMLRRFVIPAGAHGARNTDHPSRGDRSSPPVDDRRTPRSVSCASRSLNFWILPEAVWGKPVTKRTWRGILKRAICPSQKERSSSAVAAAPALGRTDAATSSPNRSLWTP